MAKLKKPKKIEILRHSLAHVLAAAVLEMFPEAKFGVGPAVENGFYYDFDLPRTLIPEDLEILENKMKKIIEANYKFEKADIYIKEAIKNFKKAKQPYKVELIKDIEKEEPRQTRSESRSKQAKSGKVSIYRTGKFIDLCSGPHLDSTGEINPKAFKLTKISGAYWKGNEKNKMLQRIYGVAFETSKELKKYFQMIKEAEKRDHRKLGKELDLFMIPPEIGPGLVVWLPKGAVIRHEIEKLIQEEQTKRGYQYIYTPHIGKKDLWITSGHWDLYKDKMYSPMKIDKTDYLVKPMNCPMHISVYKYKPRSYRELPFRVAEVATVYRYEQAGELSGLARVRYITQDDAHIFCREDQIVNEFMEVIDYIEHLYKIFGFKDYEMWLTLRDPKNKDKYLGSDKIWKMAERAVAAALKKKGYDFIRAEGEAKFYGPSLDIIIRDSLGRQWQCATVQLDFMLPQRFNLKYIDKDGQEKTPIMIHRAPLGSLERFFSLLIEHYAGAFPLWLSPVQVEVIPVSDKFKKYGEQINSLLLSAGIRSQIYESSESLGKRIREAEKQKIPYMLIVGAKEQKAKTAAVRNREKGDVGMIKIEKFLEKIKKEIDSKL